MKKPLITVGEIKKLRVVGRNNNGVIFKIIPSKLPQEETEGEYYIIDGNNELVTSGNYYYI